MSSNIYKEIDKESDNSFPRSVSYSSLQSKSTSRINNLRQASIAKHLPIQKSMKDILESNSKKAFLSTLDKKPGILPSLSLKYSRSIIPNSLWKNDPRNIRKGYSLIDKFDSLRNSNYLNRQNFYQNYNNRYHTSKTNQLKRRLNSLVKSPSGCFNLDRSSGRLEVGSAGPASPTGSQMFYRLSKHKKPKPKDLIKPKAPSFRIPTGVLDDWKADADQENSLYRLSRHGNTRSDIKRFKVNVRDLIRCSEIKNPGCQSSNPIITSPRIIRHRSNKDLFLTSHRSSSRKLSGRLIRINSSKTVINIDFKEDMTREAVIRRLKNNQYFVQEKLTNRDIVKLNSTIRTKFLTSRGSSLLKSKYNDYMQDLIRFDNIPSSKLKQVRGGK